MRFLKGLYRFIQREKSDGASEAARTGATPLFVYGAGSSAMSIATVYCCVKLVSESVANLPVLCQRLRGDVMVADETSPWWPLLNVQPDAARNAFEFWRDAVQAVLLDGNAYIVPQYDAVEPVRFVLCGRGTVSHDTLNDTYSVADPVNGLYGTFGEDEVIHLKNLTGTDSKRGVSVLSYARLTTGIAASGDQETHNRFVNGGNVRGLVTNDGTRKSFGVYQDEELKKTAKTLDERFQAGERIVSLPGQVDFKPISLSSTDMQFLESRKFTVREICRFFGVHPSFVFDDTSNNYKSAEQANVAFLSHTLNPLLRNIETELLRKLVAPKLWRKRAFRFDRQSLHACDLDGRMGYLTRLLQIGVTVNEVRRMLDLPSVPGGDVALVSANLKGLDEAAAVPTSTSNDNDQNNDQD